MRLVRTPEGFLVDEETGEVLEDKPIDCEHPEYRVYSYEDASRKEHYAPMERWSLFEELSIGDPPPQFLALRRSIDRESEAIALRVGGYKGLAIYKCLRFMGCDKHTALYAVKKLVGGVEGSGKWVSLAFRLGRVFDDATSNALIRWVSYCHRGSLSDRDLQRLGELRRTKYGYAAFLELEGVSIQVMRRKIDISSRLYESEKVLRAIQRLSQLLGVDLTLPRPMVATIVIRPPFAVSLELAKLMGTAISSTRIKIARKFYTMLVFRRVVNIYAKLDGNLERIDEAVADSLPLICLCASTQ